MPPVPAWRRFLAQFSDTTVQLLLVATAVSIGLWIYERDEALPYEGPAILAIVALNAILGFTEEASAERSLAALRALAGARATLVRGGERRSVDTADLVAGRPAGRHHPADARLVESVPPQFAVLYAPPLRNAFATSPPCPSTPVSGSSAPWSPARSCGSGADQAADPPPLTVLRPTMRSSRRPPPRRS